ncbi:hypothetical protein ACFFHF_12345 [Robertmurraya beringensis]|uniref:NADH dehydrogenase subunit 4 n=1 Tax=Robertmurraya beringensis TaxID=641660 RepID=A0ABV6KSR4_9BACI
MLLVIIILAFISILLLVSLKRLQKRFDPIEIFLLFMFNSYNGQNFFYLLSSPYQHLRVVEKHLSFWSARIHYGIVLPVLLMWVMYVLRGSGKLSLKISLCILWIIAGVLMDKMLLVVGVLESKGGDWYPSVDMVIAMIVLCTGIYFMDILPSILRREKVIKGEGDI